MNKNNLLKLAAKLESLPADYDHFNMRYYAFHGETGQELDPDEVKEAFQHNCGTVACAIGHAPTIPGLEASKDESWEEYSERVFEIEFFSRRWDYLFDCDWAYREDPRHHTAQAAAKRIRTLVETGECEEDYLDA